MSFRGRTAQHLVWLLISMAALGVLVLPAARVAADQNPPGCTQNNLALDIGRDKTIVRNGDTIVYTISAANVDSAQGPACNFSATSFVFYAPAADGTPTGQPTVLRSNIDFPAGTARIILGQVPYFVAVNPGVTDTVAKATAVGALHDAPINHQANVMKTLGSAVTQPHTTLSASVALTGTVPPLTALSTYVEKNDSSTPAPMVSVTVTDDGCSPVIYAGGDANGNKVLDPGEAWIFGCSRPITTPGTYVSHATASGMNVEDNRLAPPEAAQVSITVLAAKGLPATAVQRGGGQLKGAIPVTGPTVPVAPLGILGLGLIATGLLCVRRRRLPKR
jgi:hypothetical protein